MEPWIEGLLAGNRRATAKVISAVERGGEGARSVSDALWSKTGRGLRIGVTGPPGVGKSTLVDALARAMASEDKPAAILAVDPSSAFTRGALLGDRIRMADSAARDDIYVRSMANRGRLGGLAPSTSEAADVLDAAGYATIFLETVGVGQAEIEVAFESDLTMVVLAPGAGDGIQAIKAGLMEVADVFVVNKCELEGAERVVSDIQGALELSSRVAHAPPPVSMTNATAGVGIEELVATIDRVAGEARQTDRFEKRRRHVLAKRLLAAATKVAGSRIEERIAGRSDVLDALAERKLTLGEAVEQVTGVDDD